jgi:DNA polymerase-3 subunit gamma/tau
LAAFSKERLVADSQKIEHSGLVRLVELFYEAANNARWSVDPRITAEMALLTACVHEKAASAPQPVVRVAAPVVAIPEPERGAQIKPAPKSAPAVSPAQPKPVAVPLTASGAPPESKSGGSLNDRDLERAMEELLKRVEQAGKRSVKALLEDASLAGHSEGVVTLLFQRETIRERVDKDDIRKWLEELMTQLLGTSIRLHCTTKLPVARAKETERPAKQPAGEIPEAVIKMQQMFGGQITKIEEDVK